MLIDRFLRGVKDSLRIHLPDFKFVSIPLIESITRNALNGPVRMEENKTTSKNKPTPN